MKTKENTTGKAVSMDGWTMRLNRTQGVWMLRKDGIYCSVCGKKQLPHSGDAAFCGMCGSIMRKAAPVMNMKN